MQSPKLWTDESKIGMLRAYFIYNLQLLNLIDETFCLTSTTIPCFNFFRQKKKMNQQHENLLKVAIYTVMTICCHLFSPSCHDNCGFLTETLFFRNYRDIRMDSLLPLNSFLVHIEFEYTKRQIKKAKLCGCEILNFYAVLKWKWKKKEENLAKLISI